MLLGLWIGLQVFSGWGSIGAEGGGVGRSFIGLIIDRVIQNHPINLFQMFYLNPTLCPRCPNHKI